VFGYQSENLCAYSVGKDLGPKSPNKLHIGKTVAPSRPGPRNTTARSDCTNRLCESWRNTTLTSVIELFTHPRAIHWHCSLKDGKNHTKTLSTLFSQILLVKLGKEPFLENLTPIGQGQSCGLFLPSIAIIGRTFSTLLYNRQVSSSTSLQLPLEPI